MLWIKAMLAIFSIIFGTLAAMGIIGIAIVAINAYRREHGRACWFCVAAI